MMPDYIHRTLEDDSDAQIEARLEHLAEIISGQGSTDATTPMLANLRELYESADPVSIRFVHNLLHCAACTSNWRCDHCDYRQVASDGAGR